MYREATGMVMWLWIPSRFPASEYRNQQSNIHCIQIKKTYLKLPYLKVFVTNKHFETSPQNKRAGKGKERRGGGPNRHPLMHQYLYHNLKVSNKYASIQIKKVSNISSTESAET
jgi:hypothetical protein